MLCTIPTALRCTQLIFSIILLGLSAELVTSFTIPQHRWSTSTNTFNFLLFTSVFTVFISGWFIYHTLSSKDSSICLTSTTKDVSALSSTTPAARGTFQRYTQHIPLFLNTLIILFLTASWISMASYWGHMLYCHGACGVLKAACVWAVFTWVVSIAALGAEWKVDRRVGGLSGLKGVGGLRRRGVKDRNAKGLC